MRGIYNKPEKPIIAKRECIQINRRFFLSTKGAASYWAWRRIAVKHTALYQLIIKRDFHYHPDHPVQLEEIKKIYDIECVCEHQDGAIYRTNCLIHAKGTGYLSRLHKRYSRVLKLAFDAQLNEVKDENR